MNKKRITLYGLVTLVLLLASVQMLRLPKYNFDEYFTINLVRNSWGDVIRLTGLDVHPPLYYLFVKGSVLVFGENFFSWHLVSFACFLFLLAMTESFLSAEFSEKTALLGVLALCSAPNMLRYCLQVRMYSMAMLFTTAVYFISLRILRDFSPEWSKRSAKDWGMLGIFGLAAAYTHYFAGVAVVGLMLFLLLALLRAARPARAVLLQWGMCCVAMAALYLPWLLVMVRQMNAIQGNYWIRPIHAASFSANFRMIFAESEKVLQYGLCIVFLLGVFFHLKKKEKDIREYWSFGAVFSTAFFFAFGIGYSFLRTPILNERYIVVLLPMLWIFAVVALEGRRERWIKALFILLFVGCFWVNRRDLLAEYRAVETREEIGCLRQNFKESDVFYQVNAQRLAERAAFLPKETVFLLEEGCDAREAFHYWPDMIGCMQIEDACAAMEWTEQNCPEAAIWCEDDEVAAEFSQKGYEIQEFPAWSVVFYRMTRK